MATLLKLKEILSIQKISFYLVIIIPTIASLVINALLGKVIAVYLDPASFGLYALQFVVFSLVNSIFFIPLVNTYKTYRNVLPSSEAIQFFDAIITISSLLTAAGLFILQGWVPSIFTPVIALILSALLFFQGLFSVRLASIQLTSDFKGHGWYTILNASMNLLILWFLTAIVKQQNHVSVWIAVLIASIISLMAIWQKIGGARIRLSWRHIADTELVHKMKGFIWPLMVVAFLNSINNYADRYLIEMLMTTRDVGIYAAGYGLGSKVLFLMTPILLYLSPIVYNNVNIRPDIVFRTIHKVLIFNGVAGVFVCSFLYFLKTPIGNIFLSQSYLESFEIIPLIGFGFLFYNAVLAIETYFYASGNSRIILYHNILGAVVNVVLNVLLIPYHGIIGAAIASILGFSTQFLFCYIIMKIYKGQSIMIKDKNVII